MIFRKKLVPTIVAPFVFANIAPVWNGESGTGFSENPDDLNWATMLDKYLNGQLGSKGAPTFSGNQQGIGMRGCRGPYRIQGPAAAILESSIRMDRGDRGFFTTWPA